MTTRRIQRIGLIGAVAAALVLGSPTFAATTPATASFFNSVEVKNTNLKKFKKWTGAVERYFAEMAKNEGPCSATEFNKCHYQEWQAFIDSVRGMPRTEQLNRVNKFLNSRRYITDPINWGVKDYWETPGEFFTKNGDCEDYAITKYMTLRDLGFAIDELRIVAVKDLNLRIGHAILAVFLDGDTLILDNQIKVVVQAKKIRHYKPIYSLNENAWWRHKRKK